MEDRGKRNIGSVTWLIVVHRSLKPLPTYYDIVSCHWEGLLGSSVGNDQLAHKSHSIHKETNTV